MVKSRTRKKSAKPRDLIVEQKLGQVTDHIKKWTNHELGKLQTRDHIPVCIPVADGYKIGLYKLKVYPNKLCDLSDHNGEFVHRFEHKISAIIYTIYVIKHKYYAADEILMWDREINKNYTDLLSLRRTIEQARIRKDYITVDTRLCRLEIAESKLNFAREQIARIHKHAKLSKVWQ